MHWNRQVADVLGEDKIWVWSSKTPPLAAPELSVSGLFVAIGHTLATKFLEGSGLTFDDSGYIHLSNRGSETNLEGVFAAGDVADSVYRQAITAAGMGCQAAMDAERWLASRE